MGSCYWNKTLCCIPLPVLLSSLSCQKKFILGVYKFNFSFEKYNFFLIKHLILNTYLKWVWITVCNINETNFVQTFIFFCFFIEEKLLRTNYQWLQLTTNLSKNIENGLVWIVALHFNKVHYWGFLKGLLLVYLSTLTDYSLCYLLLLDKKHKIKWTQTLHVSWYKN